MKNKTNFFERLELVCSLNGVDGISALAKKLSYSSPEKLYRINRVKVGGEFNSPSFEIIVDLANMFDDLNIRWLVTGDGIPFPNLAAEPKERYMTKAEVEELLNQKLKSL